MGIKDIFKRKKQPQVIEALEKNKEKELRKTEKPKEITPVAKTDRKPIIGEAYKVLKSPHISEKATDLVKKNQYCFNVWDKANKKEIKKAVEGIYGVNVLSVRIIKIPSKKRRLGRTSGFKKGYKKAIATIQEGQKIEIMPR